MIVLLKIRKNGKEWEENRWKITIDDCVDDD